MVDRAALPRRATYSAGVSSESLESRNRVATIFCCNLFISIARSPCGSHLEHLNVKQNYPFTFVILACLISYTLTVMKIKLYEKKISTNATQSQAHQGSINQGTLASLGSIGFHFVLSIFASLSYYILNTRDNTVKLFGYN